MSQGLLCLNCRKYIEGQDPQWRCQCPSPRPSWDGRTESSDVLEPDPMTSGAWRRRMDGGTGGVRYL